MKRAALALLFAPLLTTGAAHADAMPHVDKGLFVPVGINLGYGMNPGVPNGLLFGAEASVVYFDQLRWIGLYGDVIRDFGADQTRFSVGPELGALFFTIDGGYLGGDAGKGYVVRFLIDAVVPHVYARVGHLVDQGADFGEVGILLKFPLPVAQWSGADRQRGPMDGRPPPPPPPAEPEPPTPDGPIMPDAPDAPDEPTGPRESGRSSP